MSIWTQLILGLMAGGLIAHFPHWVKEQNVRRRLRGIDRRIERLRKELG